MAKRRRRMFTAAESAEVWDRWQRGEGLNADRSGVRTFVGRDLPALKAAWRHSTAAATTIATGVEPG